MIRELSLGYVECDPDDIRVRLTGSVLLTDGRLVKETLLLVVRMRCSKCGTRIDEEREERFHTREAMCFDCVPGFSSLDFCKRTLMCYVRPNDRVRFCTVAQQMAPHSTRITERFNPKRGCYQMYWSYDPGEMYSRTRRVRPPWKQHTLQS